MPLALQLLLVASAFAQPANPLLAGASLAKDLEFPLKPSRLSLFSVPEMALYRPDGPGPFPAIVLHHQCGGLGQGKWQNLSMLEWARQAVAKGYVSFYPGCFTVQPAANRPFEIVNPDIDRPLLVLIGGRDTETPAADCVPKLEAAKAAGAPVEWHVYPAATHCCDCKNLDGASKVDVRGSHVVYRYDKDITSDSARRMFEFLEKTLAARR